MENNYNNIFPGGFGDGAELLPPPENMSGFSGSDNNSPRWLENFIFDDSHDYMNLSELLLATRNSDDDIHNPAAVSRGTMKRQRSNMDDVENVRASSSCISTQHLQDSTSSSTRLWVKVEYKNDVVKFVLSLPTMDGLKTQVLKRYNNLEADGMKFMYKDEDGEMITIACDEDLDCCFQYFNSSGRAPVRLSLSF